MEAGEKITLSADPFNHEYLIPDAEVLVNQEDLLQQEIPPLCDVIILQSVLLEVRKRSISVFNQVSTLLRNRPSDGSFLQIRILRGLTVRFSDC